MTVFRIMARHRFGNADGEEEICRVSSEEIANQIAEKLRKGTFQAGTRRFRRYGKAVTVEPVEETA